MSLLALMMIANSGGLNASIANDKKRKRELLRADFGRVTRELEELGLMVLWLEFFGGGVEVLFGMASEGPVGWLALDPNGVEGAEPPIAGSIVEIGSFCASSPEVPAHPIAFAFHDSARGLDGPSVWRSVHDYAQGDEAVTPPVCQGLSDPAVREFGAERGFG